MAGLTIPLNAIVGESTSAASAYATAAASSATNSATSATNAATSETNAGASAASATASATNLSGVVANALLSPLSLQSSDKLRDAVFFEKFLDAANVSYIGRVMDKNRNVLFDATAESRQYPDDYGYENYAMPLAGFPNAKKAFTIFGKTVGFIQDDSSIVVPGGIGPANVNVDTSTAFFIRRSDGALCLSDPTIPTTGELVVIPAANGPIEGMHGVPSKATRQLIKRHGAVTVPMAYYIRRLSDGGISSAFGDLGTVDGIIGVGQSNMTGSEAFVIPGTTYPLPAPYATTNTPGAFFLYDPVNGLKLDERQGLSRGAPTSAVQIIAANLTGITPARAVAGISNVHGMTCLDVVGYHYANQCRDVFGLSPTLFLGNIAIGATLFRYWTEGTDLLMGTPATWKLLADVDAWIDAAKVRATALGKRFAVRVVLCNWGQSDADGTTGIAQIQTDHHTAVADIKARIMARTGQLVPPVFIENQPCINNTTDHFGAWAIQNAQETGLSYMSASDMEAPFANLAGGSPHYSAAGAICVGDHMMDTIGSAMVGATRTPLMHTFSRSGGNIVDTYSGGRGSALVYDNTLLADLGNKGYQLFTDATLTTPISITSVTVSGRTVTIVPATALPVNGVVKYAGQTVNSTTRASGNIRETASWVGASGATRYHWGTMARKVLP